MAKRERSDEIEGRPMHRPRRKKGLVRRFVLLGFVVSAVLVALAPTIAGRMVHRYELLSDVLPEGWTLDSEQAAFGWFSHQSLEGVTVVDAEGNTLFTAESVTLPKTLSTLVLDYSDLGKIRIVRPVLALETHSEGSNAEDFVNSLLELPSDSPSSNVNLEVEIVEGTVHGLGQNSGEQWSLEQVDLIARIQETISAKGSAELLASQSSQRGKIQFRMEPVEKPIEGAAEQSGAQQVELLAERLPLVALKPWLARVAPDLQFHGTLSTDAKLTWQEDPNTGLHIQSTGRLEASQLQLTGAALQTDRLQTTFLKTPWELTYADNRLTLKQFHLKTDWANLVAAGSLSLTELQSFSLKNLPQRAAQISGNVDLAQLSTMLPQTLQLRPGVRIDKGQLEFTAAANPAAGQRTWQAIATLKEVAGSDGARQIRWEQPIVASVNLRDTPVGAQLEQFTLSAPFVNATLQTRADSVEGDFSLNLAQFSQELSQFVDLQAWELRGSGEGNFSLTRQQNQQFTAQANLELTDLHVAERGSQNAWSEPRLLVELNATGTEHDLSPRSLATGKVTIQGPLDQLELNLLRPVDLVAEHPPWNLEVEGNGPLALWSARLRPWVANLPTRLEGDAHLKAKVDVSGNAVEIVESNGSVVQLQIEEGAVKVDEPRIEFSGDCRWDFLTEILQTKELLLLGRSCSFRTQDIVVGLAAQGAPPARGSVAFSADLERLAAMASLVGQSGATWPRGTAVGRVQLTSQAEQVQADIKMKVQQFELVKFNTAQGAAYGRPEIVWEEPELDLEGLLKYEAANDRVQLDDIQVRGKTLQLNGSTRLDRMSHEGLLDANGLVEYDSQELSKLIASYAGHGVQLHGDRQVRFQLAGPLFFESEQQQGSEIAGHWLQQWNVTAEAGWASAAAYGLPMGGGRLKGSLNKGQLEISPLDVAVGQGRLTAAPSVLLMPSPAHVLLEPGLLVSNVEISPEVSEKMLKYVAPILAGATRTSGQFSIDLVQAKVPIGRAERARVHGHLVAHRLQVAPGPTMNQLIAIVKQIESLVKHKELLQVSPRAKQKSFLTMAEQKVEFQVVEGRVYHRNLEFSIDGVPVRSAGSVGFDQTLSLELEVPIQDDWGAKEPALRSLAGQVLKLPVRGTFQNPQIDQRAVADLSKRLLKGVAQQAIGDELNRQFDKLFRKK